MHGRKSNISKAKRQVIIWKKYCNSSKLLSLIYIEQIQIDKKKGQNPDEKMGKGCERGIQRKGSDMWKNAHKRNVYKNYNEEDGFKMPMWEDVELASPHI